MVLIQPFLCAVCGAKVVIVYVYKSTAGAVLDHDALCGRHKGA